MWAFSQSSFTWNAYKPGWRSIFVVVGVWFIFSRYLQFMHFEINDQLTSYISFTVLLIPTFSLLTEVVWNQTCNILSFACTWSFAWLIWKHKNFRPFLRCSRLIKLLWRKREWALAGLGEGEFFCRRSTVLLLPEISVT